MRELRRMVICALAVAIAGGAAIAGSAIAAGCATAGAGPGANADAGAGADSGNQPDAAIAGLPDAGPDASTGTPMTVTLRQSVSDTIIKDHSVACGSIEAPFYHRENRYFRVYDLAALGINTAFTVTTVHVGIEVASTEVGTSQPANLRLHTLSVGTPVLANLTQLGSVPVTVDTQTRTIIDIPISAIVPAGSRLAVEFQTPDGLANTNLIYIGSNTGGESQSGYLTSPASGCGITELTTPKTTDPNLEMHMILKVTGSYTP